MPSQFGNLIQSTLIHEKPLFKESKQIQIPSQFQIQAMFDKNGFRSNNVVTKLQLKQVFDRQYALNNLEEFNEDQLFSSEIFQELWGHLELLSEGTVKIQNVCKVLHDALQILKQRIQLLNSPKGIKGKQKQLDQQKQKQKQLTDQLDLVDAEFDYHQEKIKSERNSVRMNIGKLSAQIQQLYSDRQNFQSQLKMLLLTIGQHKDAPIETRILEQGVMSLFGLQKKVNSGDLKFIFIVTILSIILELFILTYRFSFFTMLGLCCVLYVLFLGYHTDRSVVYIIVYFVGSVFLDLGYAFLNMFTTFILNPIIYTENKFLKFIGMGVLLFSVVLRMILVLKLLKYKQIPKNLEYFQFWGEQITLNRRNKHFKNFSQSQNLSH